jgi:hypothetical protein
MITNIGKNLLAKYLVGQTQSYASHIAVGCGASPLASDGNFGDYSLKNSLDFEMFRVPIISRGFVKENGIDKVVLTAELPTEERYEITEIGIFSAASNPVAGSFDSRSVYSFTDTDNWLYQPFGSPAIAIPPKPGPLDEVDDNGIINVFVPGTSQRYNVFTTNADNRIFTNPIRVARNERCRFLNNIIVMVGNDSTLTRNVSGKLDIGLGSKYIRLNETTVDFTKNSPLDELRLAFSVINKVPGTDLVPASVPDNVKIILEFSYTGSDTPQEYARFEVDIDDLGYTAGTSLDERDLSTNRYLIVKKALKDLNKTDNFDWREVTVAKIYSCVSEAGVPSDQFYVCLDGLRLENITSTNSLYGLTGYSVIRTVGSKPIVKAPNTTNYIEFRFSLGV